MYVTTIKSAALVAILAIVLGPGIASGEMLLSDNFDRPDNGNVSAGLPTGQAGTLASVSYVEDETAQILSSRLRLGSPVNSNTAWVVPEHDFVDTAITDAGGFVIEFDADPDIAYEGTSGYFAAVSFGHSYASATTNGMRFNAAGASFGIHFRDNGTAGAFVAGTGLTEVAYTAHGGFYHFKITAETTSFENGESGAVTVNVDGTDVYTSEPVVWTGANYINLEGYGESSKLSDFDNLEIYTIPEPSTLVLLASVAGLMILWRRRTVA